MSTWARVRSLPALILIGLVRAYQLVISPWTPPTCKYYPSCSSYAVTALRRHGALRGGWLAARRLGRCHPWAAGGVDDVPPVVDRSGPVDSAAEHAPHQTSARTGHHIAHAGHH